MSSYATNLEDLAHWIGRQLEWSGGSLVGDELIVAPLADDFEGQPAGFLIPRQTLLFNDDRHALQIRVVVGRDLNYVEYSYHFMDAGSGELNWRFDKHPVRDQVPETHLHLPPAIEQHLPFREVEVDEVIDWVHRYADSQETPLPD